MPTLETETDYYTLLGIDPGADAVTIRKAVVGEQRRWGARQNSPVLAARQEAERYAQLLTDVRDVLLDPGRRALYDVQRVEAMPTWSPAPQPAPGTRRLPWPARQGQPVRLRGKLSWRVAGMWRVAGVWPSVGVVLALVILLFLATQVSNRTSATAVAMPGLTLQTPIPLVPNAAADTAAKPAPQRASPTARPVPTALLATQPALIPRTLPDEVPVMLSGTPLLTSIVPALTQPFSLAGGHYSLVWSVAGHQPCDFVITIADPVTPALARTTLFNHILNRIDGQPAQGQTSVNLNSGKYRLEAYSDTCAWNLTLHAG